MKQSGAHLHLEPGRSRAQDIGQYLHPHLLPTLPSFVLHLVLLVVPFPVVVVVRVVPPGREVLPTVPGVSGMVQRQWSSRQFLPRVVCVRRLRCPDVLEVVHRHVVLRWQRLLYLLVPEEELEY